MGYEDFWNALSSIPVAGPLVGPAVRGYERAREIPGEAEDLYELLSAAMPIAGPVARSYARYQTEPGQSFGPEERGVRDFDLGDPMVREQVLSGAPIKGGDTVMNSRGTFSRSEKPISKLQGPEERRQSNAIETYKLLQDNLSENELKYLREKLSLEEKSRKLDRDAQKVLADIGLEGTKYQADKNLEGVGVRAESDYDIANRGARAQEYGARQARRGALDVAEEQTKSYGYGNDRKLEGEKYEADARLSNEELRLITQIILTRGEEVTPENILKYSQALRARKSGAGDADLRQALSAVPILGPLFGLSR